MSFGTSSMASLSQCCSSASQMAVQRNVLWSIPWNATRWVISTTAPEYVRIPSNIQRKNLPYREPHYCVRIQFKGKRPCFTTGTGNKDAAARIARDIYMDLLTKGLEATLAARRPVKEKQAPLDRVASVGEYIAAVKKVTTVDAGTFGSYCRCLRSIVADIVGMEKSSKRFHHGNAAGYRKKIDVVRLDVLTPTAVQEWRIRFTQRANSKMPWIRRSRRPVPHSNPDYKPALRQVQHLTDCTVDQDRCASRAGYPPRRNRPGCWRNSSVCRFSKNANAALAQDCSSSGISGKRSTGLQMERKFRLHAGNAT